MTHTTLTVPPEVLEESGIDLEAILQFTRWTAKSPSSSLARAAV